MLICQHETLRGKHTKKKGTVMLHLRLKIKVSKIEK